jgi:hypothetical protein
MSGLRKRTRVAVALGGFLMFVGGIMATISALAFFGVLNVPNELEEGRLFMWFILIISLLNVVGGVLLLYRHG